MRRVASISSAPSWWFGAPLFGVLFGFFANRFFPELVVSASGLIYRASGHGAAPPLAPDLARYIAPLVGTVLAVAVFASWQLVTFVRRHRS